MEVEWEWNEISAECGAGADRYQGKCNSRDSTYSTQILLLFYSHSTV